jgi:hypothetical protein
MVPVKQIFESVYFFFNNPVQHRSSRPQPIAFWQLTWFVIVFYITELILEFVFTQMLLICSVNYYFSFGADKMCLYSYVEINAQIAEGLNVNKEFRSKLTQPSFPLYSFLDLQITCLLMRHLGSL